MQSLSQSVPTLVYYRFHNFVVIITPNTDYYYLLYIIIEYKRYKRVPIFIIVHDIVVES